MINQKRSQGGRTVRLNGRRLKEPGPAHIYLRHKLQLPGCYGDNLDALYDCLTALPAGSRIVLYNAGNPEPEEGTFLFRVERVLIDAAAKSGVELDMRQGLFT